MLELEVYAAGLGELDKILELDHQLSPFRGCVTKSIGTTTWFISSSTNPPSPFAKSARSFANSRSIHVHRRNSGRASAKTKRSRWVYKHNAKCSLDSLTRSEGRSSGSFSIWARWFSWPRIRSTHFSRIDCAGNYFSTKLSRSDCFRNWCRNHRRIHRRGFYRQTYFQFHKIGMGSAVGAVVSVAILRELGPVLTALMVTVASARRCRPRSGR